MSDKKFEKSTIEIVDLQGIEIVKLIGGDLAFKGFIKKSEWEYL